MTRTFLIASAVALGLGLGCGDDRDRGRTTTDGSTSTDSSTSTLDPGRTIASLDLAEARAICEDFTAAQGGPGTVAMCDGLELTVQSVDDCATTVDAATCTNTVGEMNACLAALDGDACTLLTDPACAFVFSCAMSGS
jgi:hypothetical protein